MTDRSLVKKPRPVVFSLAELQRYPTLEDRYAITLPFGPVGRCHYHYCYRCTKGCVSCKEWDEYLKAKAKCIKRTGERWAWFSAARDLDDGRGERLGTLGYLPWEIRQEIMKALLNNRYNHGHGEVMRKGYFGERIDPFKYVDFWSGTQGMRLASPSTKVEFEHCYLTETTFVFEDPISLEAFLDQLPIYQQRLLRSFALRFVSLQNCDFGVNDWVAVCAHLPPNLMSIHFDVWSWTGCAMNLGGEWFVCDDSWYEVQPAINLLDLLGKRAQRFAARAKIGLGPGYDHPKHVYPSGEGWVRVLHELEPWSADWLKWWEEATKVASNDGEGASDIA